MMTNDGKYCDLGLYASGGYPYIDAFLKTDLTDKIDCPEFIIKSINQITDDLENTDMIVQNPGKGQRVFMTIDATREEEASFVDGSVWINPSFLRCSTESRLNPSEKQVTFIFLSAYDDEKLPGKDITSLSGRETHMARFIMKRKQCWRLWASERSGVFYLKNEPCVPGTKYDVL